MDDKTTRELIEALLDSLIGWDGEVTPEQIDISGELRSRIPDQKCYAIARPGWIYLSGWVYPVYSWDDID
jgi:hypothetical protein